MKPTCKLALPDQLSQLSNDDVHFYYSAYPDVTPTYFRKNSYRHLATTVLSQIVVDNFEDNIMMRGQSRYRFSIEEKEEIKPSELLATLPSRTSEMGPVYLTKGQYDKVVPLSINITTAIASLRKSRTAPWGMFAPFPAYAVLKPAKAQTAQNCCSALVLAFKAGGADLQKPVTITQLPTLVTLALYAIYFSVLYLMQDTLFSESTLLDNLLFAPVLHLTRKLGISIKDTVNYYRDLTLMDREPPKQTPAAIRCVIFCVCAVINMICSPIQPNAMGSTFIHPAHLLRLTETYNHKASTSSKTTAAAQAARIALSKTT